MALNDEELNRRREEREKEQKLLERQMKALKIGVAVTLAVILVCCGTMLAVTQGWIRIPVGTEPSGTVLQTQPPQTQPTQTQPPPTETEPPADTVIHLIAGGDVNVTQKVVASGAKEGGYDYTRLLMDALPALSGGDLTVLNFEGFVSDDPKLVSAPKELLQALKNAGADILQTANSQSIAGGLLGLTGTLDAIRNAGMEPLGTYKDGAEFEKYQGFTVREIQGIRVAFVAFTKGMGGMGLPLGSEQCVNLLYKDYATTYQTVDKDGIRKLLRNVSAAKPDLTVAMLHWGSEYNSQISKTQETITKLMQEEGVDAIIGTHSHYVQQMVYDGEQGTFVAYSLGDLVGDGDKAGTEYSVVLDLEITKDGSTGAVKITGFDYVPMYIVTDEEGNPVQLMRIREAMAAYEQNSVNRVTEDVYQKMKSALSKIESRVGASKA